MIDPASTSRHSHADLAQRVGALLGRQHDLLGRLEALSRRQMAHLGADQADRLLEVLAERQHITERLQEASDLLGPLRPAWHAAAPALPREQQESLTRQARSIGDLLDAIGTRDAEARRLLAERRDLIAADLLHIGKGRDAVAAYAGPAPSAPPSLHDDEA
ncbi:MAG: hypothetical protein WD749_00685 [Phycisphaerales bacterium]